MAGCSWSPVCQATRHRHVPAWRGVGSVSLNFMLTLEARKHQRQKGCTEVPVITRRRGPALCVYGVRCGGEFPPKAICPLARLCLFGPAPPWHARGGGGRSVFRAARAGGALRPAEFFAVPRA